MQFRLSAWLSGVIVLIAVAAGMFSYYSAFEEANELQDDQLVQVAGLVNRQVLPVTITRPANSRTKLEAEARFVVQALPDLGSTAQPPAVGAVPFPLDLPNGLQTVVLGSDTWRAFVLDIDLGPRVVVAQLTAIRDETASDGALRTVLPFLVLVPVLLLLVADLIRQMFKPLRTLSADIDGRSEQDLHAISDAGLPDEIRPFVVAINRLLSRVSESAGAQRRFIADAAHELRSPLTALSLQAERMDAAELSAQARERLDTLRQGIKRTRTLLEQLLTLARVQDAVDKGHCAVSVQAVFRAVVEDLMPLAQAKRIDVGVIAQDDAQIEAQGTDLQILIKNLVENAIRYTPPDGRVDLSVQTTPQGIELRVEDTGPGIPLAERARVFDPFYRVLGHDADGSGLGLSIVKTIAERYQARVALDSANPQTVTGLRVTVVFPNDPQATRRRDDASA